MIEAAGIFAEAAHLAVWQRLSDMALGAAVVVLVVLPLLLVLASFGGGK